MKYLIGCEFSGAVRDALIRRKIDAVSCDILPTEAPGPHIQGDIIEVINRGGWDVLIVFPPCTDLAVSGARHFAAKRADGRQQKSEAFFMAMANAPIKYIAIENPVGIMSTKYRKPDQIINPWQYGHECTKATCLWLKNLPLLVPTNIVSKGEFVTYANGRRSTMWHAKSGGGSGHKRSITFPGIAEAMADQWGNI